MSDTQKGIRHVNWREALVKRGTELTEADRRLLSLLADGKSTPEIARELGTNRSAVWRQAVRLRSWIGE
jgi:DNA-binding NarL/FixJ family response regulator